MSENFNEVLKNRENENKSDNKEMSLDSTERVKVLSPGQLVFKRFVTNKLAIIGTFILITMFLFAFIFPLIYPYSQTQIFYKYDNSMVDYAQATTRKDFSMTYCEGAEEIHYSVKNRLTSAINDLKSKGEKEVYLNATDGNVYRLFENDENVYSLYKCELNKVASLTSASLYATYNMIGKELTFEPDVIEVSGFENALTTAIKNKEKEFSIGPKVFIIEQEKKTYHVLIAGGGLVYEGGELGAEFEAKINEFAGGGSFAINGKTYNVVVEDGDAVAYEIGEESKVSVLTTYVIDSYEEGVTFSDDFEYAVVNAITEDMKFEYNSKSYEVKKENNEFVIYDDADTTKPVCALSTLVIRRYNGEDSLSYDFKQNVHQLIEKMDADGVKKTNFEWLIAQVDENGEYTYDENGEIIKDMRTVTIENKNGFYVMSAEQVVYLIDTFAKPSLSHPVGTDGDGMDVLARMMYGGRVSLIFSFVVIIIETVLGVIMGGIAGFFGGWVDNLIMRMVDVFYCIPSLPILIILGAMFDAMKIQPYVRVGYLMVILGILGWAGVARMVRGQILSLREQEFMVAAEALGLKTKRRIFKHLIPNVMPLLIVTATSGLGDVIITESTLSYLGLGVKHPLATWGTMISSVSTAEMMKAYTYIWIPVGLLICLTVVAFNFVGDGLRDAFDPKMKR